MDLIITGKRNKKKFRKKIKDDIKKLDLTKKKLTEIDLTPLEQCPKIYTVKLSNNKISSINLSPLSHCKALVSVYLEYNPLSSINLAPLIKCKKLDKISFSKRTKIEWLDEEFDVFALPRGLKAYLKQIRKGHSSYVTEKKEQRKKIAHENAPEKITALLNEFRPGIPINIDRIATLAEIPVDVTKSIILGILEHMPDVGEFLELEEVFIRKTEAEIEIDKLLDQFREW
ncbi:MAG: hypothetical protein ACTSQF_09145 [Candidatus Heimdallarchaeaceae archaeon]